MAGRASRRRKTAPQPARCAGDAEAGTLQAEIVLLRELIYQVGELVQSDGPVEVQLRRLDVVARACGHLARLLRAEDDLSEQASLADEIGRISEEVRREMGVRPIE